MANKYGLILSDKKAQKPSFQPTKNVFGNDADSDEESNKKPVLLRPSHISNRQAKITQEKAVIDDPTVYQYDEVYESMASKKKEEIGKKKEDKKPRYIENLLKAANKRKIENERRIERQVQKEREKEGEEFADKEVFVTTAYKKKLEEMRQEEEREKREEYLESIGDVKKQKDLGGFYRHLYEQKLGATEKISTPETKDETTPNTDDTNKNKKSSTKEKKDKKRNYRKRNADKILSDGELEDEDDEINKMDLEGIKAAKKLKKLENIDADSDFSVDDPSSDEENGPVKEIQDRKQKVSAAPDKQAKESETFEAETPPASPKKEEKIVEVKPKIDIWKKRTVGDLFDQALKRYYERKAARGS